MTSGAEHSLANPATKVTIVVPIYGDWPSLRACVASIIEHANPEGFDVLLVNDCGPDATVIEAGLRAMILGQHHIRYESNPENLGFVRTCNRAVFELDTTSNDVLLLNSDTVLTSGALEELVRVLALSPTHGAVCPRSNDATIASIPFFRRDRHEERSVARAREVHAAIAPALPEYTVAPVAIGFCFLTRRTLIEKYGLFDEIFGRGYNEENDYCLRLNEDGYSSVIANRAFVEHAGSASFGSAEREELERANAITLRERYPYYPATVVTFIHHGYDAVDRFADLLVPPRDGRPKKFLVDASGLDHDPAARESARHVLNEILNSSPYATSDLSILGTAEQLHAIGFDPAKAEVDVVDPANAESLFDVGIILTGVKSVAQLDRLRRCCLRWVVCEDGRPAESIRQMVEAPLEEICRKEGRAHADFTFKTLPTTSFDAAEAWAAITELATRPVDHDALRGRDQRLSTFIRGWQYERARGDELERQLGLASTRLRTRLTSRIRHVTRRLLPRAPRAGLR